jgi:CHAT domain-containing protein
VSALLCGLTTGVGTTRAQSVDRSVGQQPTPTPPPRAPARPARKRPAPRSAPSLEQITLPPPPSGDVPPAERPAQSTSTAVGRGVLDRAAVAPLTAQADAEADLEHYDQAATLYERALAERRAQSDRAGELAVLNKLALVYYALGRYELVLASAEAALPLARELNERAGEAAALNMLGAAQQELGAYNQAIAYYQQALAAVRASKDAASEAGALNNIGEALRLAGYCKQAVDYDEQALALVSPAARRLSGLGGFGSILGGIHSSVQRSLSVGADPKAEGVTRDSLGMAYFCLNRDAEAAEQLTAALKLHQQARNRFDEGITRNNLGRVLLRQGQPDKALAQFNAALVVNREVGNLKEEGATLGNLMLGWRARGHTRLAAFYGKQAVNTFQTIRTNLQRLDRSAQRGFLATKQEFYRALADLLIAAGRLGEAQQVVSMLKEEEYFEFVRRDGGEAAALGARAALAPGESELARRYREIADRVAALGRERGSLRAKTSLTTAEEQRLTQLESELEVAGQAFQQFLDTLARELGDTQEAADRVFQLRESQGLMDTLRELGHGAVAIYTVAGADKYRVILVTPDVQKAAEYPIRAEELNGKVAAFRAALQDPRSDPRPLAQELYKIMLGPVANDLEAAKAETLMWSLDGALRYVPVAALHDGQRYLVERYRNAVFTPASISRLKDEPRAEWTALGLGVSKSHGPFSALPAVPAELHGIINDEPAAGGVLAGRVLLDDAFTADALKTALRQRYPLVHIASHFAFQPGNETDSFLLLGDGQRLTLAQLKAATNLFSGVELLTLSACDTASGGAGADGREVESFAVLAQRQGAKAVVASLWPVADASTKLLMQNFYRRRNAQPGTPKVEALRQAQLALLRGMTNAPGGTTPTPTTDTQQRGVARGMPQGGDAATYAHPYFWAPFILIGNWK